MEFKLHSRYKPKRIILLGTSGIISENLQREFIKKNISFLKIGRKKNNFKNKSSVKLLKKLILKKDVIIFISAETPVKNKLMMRNNLKMCKNIINSLKGKDFERLIYVSSDAVYSDTKKKINETSKTLPGSLHGKMHLKRETMLIHHFKKRLCILRPTLIYGPGDNHSGYGPNQFIKLAKFRKAISLFGNGEERRDHVYIDDVVKIICECIYSNARGILNLASGKVVSFNKIAKIINSVSKNFNDIVKIKRNGPMPHNGYRPFEITKIKKNFKKIKITQIEVGIKKYLQVIK
jgi:UDP-glucose 4-epimerase